MKPITAVLFDADGVLWCGDNVVPGAPEVFDKLREMGIHPYLVTNNPTSTRNEIANRLMERGWHDIPDNMIVSAGYVATQYLLSIGFSDQRKKVFIIGEQGLIQELRNHGVNALGIEDFPPEGTAEGDIATMELDDSILAVVVALDRTLTYRKLAIGNRIIVENDALLIGTNCDCALPLGHGVYVPDCMSNVLALQSSSGRKATILGKPSKLMFEPLRKTLNLKPNEILMIGDQFKTDIQFAKNIGARSVMVLTGVAKRDDIGRAKPELKPDYVRDSVRDIPDLVAFINEKANLTEKL